MFIHHLKRVLKESMGYKYKICSMRTVPYERLHKANYNKSRAICERQACPALFLLVCIQPDMGVLLSLLCSYCFS